MENTGRKISFTIQMKTSYLFDFLFAHSYHGIYGVLNLGFSLLAIVMLAMGFGRGNAATTLMLVVLALLFTVINPALLYFKAAKQRKTAPAFQKPLGYELDKKGLTVRQENEEASSEWSEAVLLRETRVNLIIYFGAANAVVLPKPEFADKVQEVKAVIREARPDMAKHLRK